MKNAKWGKFNLLDLFGKSIRGKRLKSEDRIPGNLPFVTAGEKDEGVSAFIGNEVTVFPANTTTIDMFGSAKYRSYPYGADDHIAVVNTETLSRFASIFVTTAINKSSYNGQFNYGRNFYAKDADELIIQLPILNNGQIDYDFIENFIYAVESERLKKVETYLSITGLKSYLLTPEEEKALEQFRISQNMRGGGNMIGLKEFKVVDVFNVRNSKSILSRDIIKGSGNIPYLCASAENNAIESYISYDVRYLDKGNCVFIGGKTFVVTYQEKDFYSNDSHNLILYLKNEGKKTKLNQLFLATCIYKGLGHKYSWGDSISNRKIQSDTILLPSQNAEPDYAFMETFISAVQKLVIKEVVLYADRKIAATRAVVE